MRVGTTNTEQQQPYSWPALTEHNPAEYDKKFKELYDVLDPKLAAGRELARSAVEYLFLLADTHVIRFDVGHEDPVVSLAAQNHHQGYKAVLNFLTGKGVVNYCEENKLYSVYSNKNMPNYRSVRALAKTIESEPQSHCRAVVYSGVVIRPD